MKSLPRTWWTIVVLVGVFAMGVLCDKYVMPFLSRDVWVWTIQGVERRGCEGSADTTSFQFDWPSEKTHGVYKISCDEISVATETVALLCECGDPL